jgi:multisubunit Na+/H+ antiporter MnhC subunit
MTALAYAGGEAKDVRAVHAPLPGPAGLEHSLSPVDLPPSDQPLPDPLRWTTIVIAVATLFLALFNAHSMRSWAYELDTSPATERVVLASESWYALTARLGLNRPVESMHGGWRRVKEARFAGQPVASIGSD